ncbi:MAG: sigma-54 dependent transcriptional regulator [Pseudomonadota bacterium]
MSYRLLLVEDEVNYRKVLSLMLADFDVEIVEAEDGVSALAQLQREEVDLVITDLNMPRMDGMTLLSELRTKKPSLPVVVVTAYGSVDSAVEAMRRGAIDYLEKPFDEERLRLTLEKALRVIGLMAENRRLRDAVEARYNFSQIIGESAPMMEALRIAGQLAASDSTVLIEGESGTGKELVAQAIHYNSRRMCGPFVAVNCAALPETLLEAELFGAEAGAYTGATRRRRGRVEVAKGGTLFLDEIGDMPLSLQVKLLRFIQEKTYCPLGGETDVRADVRFLLATNRSLRELVSRGQFREDLYYRIAGLPVRLPPLRRRGGDILLLAEHFLNRCCDAMGRRHVTMSASARASLLARPFPGNVRELANVIERAVLLAENDVIDMVDLSDEGPFSASFPAPVSSSFSAGGDSSSSSSSPVSSSPPFASLVRTARVGGRALAAGSSEHAAPPVTLPEGGVSLEEVERELVRQALAKAGGNKSRAAKLLGLTRATLRYRIEKLGIERLVGDGGSSDED